MGQTTIGLETLDLPDEIAHQVVTLLRLPSQTLLREDPRIWVKTIRVGPVKDDLKANVPILLLDGRLSTTHRQERILRSRLLR